MHNDYNKKNQNKKDTPKENGNTAEIIRKSEEIISRWVTEGLKPKEPEKEKKEEERKGYTYS